MCHAHCAVIFKNFASRIFCRFNGFGRRARLFLRRTHSPPTLNNVVFDVVMHWSYTRCFSEVDARSQWSLVDGIALNHVPLDLALHLCYFMLFALQLVEVLKYVEAMTHFQFIYRQNQYFGYFGLRARRFPNLGAPNPIAIVTAGARLFVMSCQLDCHGRARRLSVVQ